MQRFERSLLALVVVCFAALTLLGCPPESVKIAAVLPLTGDAAGYGESVRRGIELAYEEIQASDTQETSLQIEYIDTESDPQKASELLRSQFKSGALAALGGVTSGEAKEMISVVDDLDRILLSPSASSPELTGISRNFYRIWPSDFTAASKMAQTASELLKVETVVVIGEQQPYAKGIQSVFAPAFENYGGEVVETLEFPPNTTDVAGLVERALSFQADAVYLAGYAPSIGALIEELRKQGFGGKILTTSAFATAAAIAEVGPEAAGVFLTQTVFEHDSDYAHIQKFVNAYNEKYGENPDIYAAHGYDAMKVLATAVNNRPGLASEVKKGLRDDIKEFPGVTGSIQFDEKGDVRKFPRVYIISEDLLLLDYNEQVQEMKERMREKQEEIRRRLERLRKDAQQVG